MAIYTVRVAIVGTARHEVEADSLEEALSIAEDCTTPIHGEDWEYLAEDVLDVLDVSVGETT